MAKNDIDPALERELLRELTHLRDEVLTASREYLSTDGPRQRLGVFRIFSGVSIQQWRSLSRSLGLDGWLTLPVDGDIYPHIVTLQESLERLSYESEHDALTGLLNRRAFERFLDLEIERTRRAKTPLSLAVIDLDDFKQINDTHGHAVGDDVLVGLAGTLTSSKRRYDLAARIGGEEFALILPGVGQVKAREMVNRLLERFGTQHFTAADDRVFQVRFSAGIASFRGASDLTVKAFVKLADHALYKAKGKGKGRVELAPLPDMQVVRQEALVEANEKKFLFTGDK